MNPRESQRFLGRLALVLGGLLAGTSIGCSGPAEFDLLIRGGTVIDGSGAAARQADIGVRGGDVAAIGDLSGDWGIREFDATGKVVAPGWVDMHSHADALLLADPDVAARLLEARARQGVTTLVVGNCGLGVAPSNEAAAEILAGVNGWMTPDGVVPGPLSTAGYLDRLEERGVVLNVATLVPHGPVRISAMGLAAGAPSTEQMTAMADTLRTSMEAGAFGLSTGLIYPPGMFSDTDELVALATIVAGHDGLYSSHVRGSSETLLPATDELLEVARRSGVRAHHSHLEAVGREYWGDVAAVLEREDAARARGIDIGHDVFPYTRAATMMAAIFPPWSLEGGLPALARRLQEPTTRRRIGAEIESRRPEWPPWVPGGWPHNLVGAVGWDGILVAGCGSTDPADADAGSCPSYVGRSLAAIGADENRSPFDVVADLMIRHEGQVGQLVDEISGQGDRVETLLSILTHPAAIVISDAEDYGRGAAHPAHSGAFVRALRWNRERELMPLPELIRRMTSLPASRVGLRSRGRIAEGAPADLVVFDPATVTDRSGWDRPREPATGVIWLTVNGKPIIEDGQYRGGAAGRILRRGSPPQPVDRPRTAGIPVE